MAEFQRGNFTVHRGGYECRCVGQREETERVPVWT